MNEVVPQGFGESAAVQTCVDRYTLRSRLVMPRVSSCKSNEGCWYYDCVWVRVISSGIYPVLFTSPEVLWVMSDG